MDFSISDELSAALEASRDEAMRTGWYNVRPDHVLLAILRQGGNDACLALDGLGVDRSLFKQEIDDAISTGELVPWQERESINPCEAVSGTLGHAALEAARCGSPYTTPLHFLLALCRMSGTYSHDWLADHGVELPALVAAAGISDYGLHPQAPEPPAPDPADMAASLEQLLKEGYTTGNPLVS